MNLPFSTYASSATAASTNLTSGTAFTAILKGIPTGYVANDTDNNSSASFANLTDAAAAKSGSTVNFYVKSSSTATDKTQSISFNLRYASDKQTPITNATIQAALSTVGKEAQYQIATGTSITNTQVLNILKAANADSFTFTGKDNNQYVATYSSFDADPAGTGANVQLQVNAYYTVTAVK